VNEPLDRLLDEAAGRVEQLEAVLQAMLAKCSWAKREQWCGCLDCGCMLARGALGQGPMPRRPDPTRIDGVQHALVGSSQDSPTMPRPGTKCATECFRPLKIPWADQPRDGEVLLTTNSPAISRGS
jgi:hypothetical protein